MSAPARAALFAVVLTVSFAAAFLVGRLAGPRGASDRPVGGAKTLQPLPETIQLDVPP